MNLSRAAKKFRAQMPEEPKAVKSVKERKKQQKLQAQAPQTAPPPVVEATPPVVEAPAAGPLPEPVAVAAPEPPPPPPPKKAWPVKAKRPRFVREQTERREQPEARPLPPRSTKLAARMMTQNLALAPKEDATKPLR